MRAIQFDKAGAAADVLTEVDIPTQEPGPGEVRVRIAFSAVNPTDVKRRATGRELGAFSPIVSHNDGSGVIDAVGAGVDKARLGERVWIFGAQAGRPMGTAAEYCVLPEWMAPKLPDNQSLLDGACLGVPAVTAHWGVFSDGDVAGQTILVSGAGGRVGHYAVLMAKAAGATVIATAGHKDNLDHAGALGADHVINYRKTDVAKAVLDITGGKGVDRVVEVAFGVNVGMFPTIVAINGVVTAYSSDEAPEPPLPFASLMFRNVTMRPFTIYSLPEAVKRRTFADVNTLLAAGKLPHRVGQVHPFGLKGVVAAHQSIEGNACHGVCAVEVAGDI